MSVNTKKTTQEPVIVKENELLVQLEKIVEKANIPPSPITYYFAERDSNPLRNAIITQMRVDDNTVYHNHDFYEINYVKKGKLYEYIDEKKTVLHEGDLLIMSPKIGHAYICPNDSLSYNFILKKDWLSSIAKGFEAYDPGNYLTSLIKNDIYTVISTSDNSSIDIHELTQTLLELNKKLNRHVDLFENLYFENRISEFLLYLTRFTRHEYSRKQGKSRHADDHSPDDIVRYINDNFDKITLEDTALRFGYSKSQLHRIIKAKTGVSFTGIIKQIRMQRARHFLLNTHIPVKNIAYLLGLDSAEHFTRMFKKYRGMTPIEYRESYMRVSLKKKKIKKNSPTQS